MNAQKLCVRACMRAHLDARRTHLHNRQTFSNAQIREIDIRSRCEDVDEQSLLTVDERERTITVQGEIISAGNGRNEGEGVEQASSSIWIVYAR